MPTCHPQIVAIALAGLAIGGSARAQAVNLRPDPGGIWTLQVENDAASTLKGTSDQYYTSGLRLGWTSGADAIAPLSTFGNGVFGPGQTRLAIDVSQSLFTPRDTQLDPPNPGDRPYAGVLLATFGLVHDSVDTRDLLSLSLGVVGPSAEGEPVQNGFHNLIGDTPNQGWGHQIQDQPAINALYQHTWRLPVAAFGPIETDALPELTGALGDVRTYAQAGATLRVGQGLASDFGSPRIAPGLNGADAFTQTRPLVWYGFAGADAQAVAYDVTLDGSMFRSNTPSVGKYWDVGEFEAGAAVIWHGVRLTYTQTWQTQEFHGAKAGLFNFGSLALSAKF